MAAESLGRTVMARGRRSRRKGFALFAAVIIIAVVAVLTTVVAVTLSGDNDQARIERTANALHGLVAAIDTVRISTGASFNGNQKTGGGSGTFTGPARLSQLTHKISATGDLNCALPSVAYGATLAGQWRGPYYLVPIPTTGYRIGPGFFANDQLVRISATDLAIQMDGVLLRDAQGLELFVEKKSSGAGPVVTFAATDPTSVRYHLISTSGNIC